MKQTNPFSQSIGAAPQWLDAMSSSSVVAAIAKERFRLRSAPFLHQDEQTQNKTKQALEVLMS